MRLGKRRAGTSTAFIDAIDNEVLLMFSADPDGNTLVSFCLYDAHGGLVADSDGPHFYPEGLTIHSVDGDLLLEIPTEPDAIVRYRLFNRSGQLLTSSDGARTQIFGFLRMEAGVADSHARSR
jgi:hypothetical protein